MLLRRWHRWVALPAALFLMFIASTGLILHVESVWTANVMAQRAAAVRGSTTPLPDDRAIAEMVRRVLDEAKREPGLTTTSISLSFINGRVVGAASDGIGPTSKRIEIDALTGERIVNDGVDPNVVHLFIQDIHAGYKFGWLGRMISILSGLSLLTLAITGLQVWYDAYRRRKTRTLFWK